MKDFFPRVAGCEFIQINRRSASFECWLYHFELNNPLSACISYSNKSMKREIWKLNLKTRKKIFSQLLAISECDYTRWKNGSFNKTSKLKKIQKSTPGPPFSSSQPSFDCQAKLLFRTTFTRTIKLNLLFRFSFSHTRCWMILRVLRFL